jgi:uncharacterized iron-regulated membrane protein
LLLRNPQRSRLRKVVFILHKWIGAIVALYILVMSLTGVSLVFHDELSAWLCPNPAVEGRAERASFGKLIENTELGFPGYKVTGVIVAAEPLQPTSVFAAKGEGEKIHCQVDPYTGTLIGLKKESEVLKFLRELHFNLLNGKTGRAVNGIGAACLFALAVTGIIVWWRGLTNWMQGFRISFSGSLKRVNWSAHSALGAWILPFLLLQSISGFYFGFPTFFEQNLNVFAPVSNQKKIVEPDANEPASLSSAGGGTITKPGIDKLIEIAQAQSRSRAVVERIAFPDKRRNSVRVWLKDSPVADANAPRTQVFLAPSTGQVLAVSTSESPPAGDQIIQWLLRFHFGTFFGTASKCAWLLVGLTPAVLATTGLFLFAHGIAYRKEKKEESLL